MQPRTRRRSRVLAAVVGVAAVAALVVGCGSSPSSSSGSSSAAPAGTSGSAAGGSGTGGGTGSPELDAALEKGGSITYWSWTPQAEAQVAAFEKHYPQVDVNLVNAGTNNDQYTKLQNAIKAGSGAPDVAQVEYYALPQFALTDSLVDLNQFGLGDLESDYTPSTWGSVNIGGGLYGLPQDSGPMAMFYNKTVFDQYGIAVPTTWDQYIAAAKTLQAADPSKFITADTGDAGFTTSMIWQAGGRPYKTDGTDVTINLQDDGAKRWTASWNQLVEGKLISDIPGWSDDWYKALGNGTICTLITGAWMPGVLESSVPDGSGQWAVAPIPTYDGKPVTAENGGGGQSVLKQSQNPALAAAFVQWLNDGEGADIFVKEGGFPSQTALLADPAWLAEAPAYFGRQEINQVLADAAGTVGTGWSYLPFQTYANSILGDTVGQAYVNSTDLNPGLIAWQDASVEYGNQQGFTVTTG